jgi:hypothetical protein
MPRPVDRTTHIARRLCDTADGIEALSDHRVDITDLAAELTPDEIEGGVALAEIALAIAPTRFRERAAEVEARR